MHRVDDNRAHQRRAFRGSLILVVMSVMASGAAPIRGLGAQQVQGVWTAGVRIGWAEDDRGFEGLAVGPMIGAGVKAGDLVLSLQGALGRGIAVGAGSCAAQAADDVIVEQSCDATLTSLTLAGEYSPAGGLSAGRLLVGGRVGVGSYRGSTGLMWSLFAGSELGRSPFALKVTYDHAEPANFSGFGLELSMFPRR